MGNRDTRIGGGEVGVEVYGAISDLTRTVKNALLSEGGGTGILIDLPTVDTSFTPIYTPEGSRLFVSLAFFIPGFTTELTVFTLDSTLVTNEATYHSERKKYTITDIGDADREAQRIERRIEIPLKPERLHYIPLLRAWDGGSPHTNPEGGFDYSGYPGNVLFSFTTPAAMTNPLNKPHVGNIIENNLDDSTSRQFDVWLSVQIIAPASASAAITGTVSTTVNSTTVTGVGTSFIADFPGGTAIEVNGEMHIVPTTPVSNTTMTVDFPFKTLNTAQAATKKTLHTFDSANIIAVAPKFRATTDSEVKALSPHTAIDEVTGLLTNIKVKVPGFFAAKTYNYVSNLAVGEGNARILSTPASTQTFTAGNFTTATANIPEWTTAPFFQYDATDPQNDNQRDVSLRITETSPPIAKDKIELYRRNAGTGTISGSTTTITGVGTAFLTELAKGHYIIASGQTLEVTNIASDTSLTVLAAPSPSISGVAWTKSVLKFEQTLQIGKFHPSAGGLIPPIKFGEIKTKKLTTFDFVAKIYALNGENRSITDSFTTDSSGAIFDTAVPSTPSAPDLQEYYGIFQVSAYQPSSNVNTVKRYQTVMSTSSSAPAGTPSVGSEGVQKIKEGAYTEFRRRLDVSVTLYFYSRVENSIGFSNWSAGTSITGSTISRPMDDAIGTGVPTQAKRLERSNTSGTGHGTSTFVLDASAEATDDYYNGMALYIPSESTGNAVQTVSDYTGSSKTCTVTPGFSGTPANSIAFEIYAGQERANRSGTGHSTTSFVLDSGASAVDDFYNGMWLYVPSESAGDRLRQVSDYVGATKACTVATYTGTPSNSIGYIINDGNFAYSHPNNIPGDTTNLIPAPMRVWKDDNTAEMVVELHLPAGENARSLTYAEIVVARQNASASVKIKEKVLLSETTVWRTPLQAGYSPAVIVTFQNEFRVGGSDGRSAASYYVPGFLSTDTPPVVYDPGAFAPPSDDIFADANRPTSRYETVY